MGNAGKERLGERIRILSFRLEALIWAPALWVKRQRFQREYRKYMADKRAVKVFILDKAGIWDNGVMVKGWPKRRPKKVPLQ
jgi:hypothetical protein